MLSARSPISNKNLGNPPGELSQTPFAFSVIDPRNFPTSSPNTRWVPPAIYHSYPPFLLFKQSENIRNDCTPRFRPRAGP
jgi:hypothetical protein